MAGAQQVTYDDLVALPSNLIGEILDGHLYGSPRPRSRHSRVASRLGFELGFLEDGDRGDPQSGGWWILYEPELHLGGDVLVPDLAGWRRSRMPVIEDVAAFTLAPDWVAEVLSPSTAKIDRVDKMRIYAREGVSNTWLIDPVAHTLEVYRLEAGRWVVASTYGGDPCVAAEPFEVREIDLARLWLRQA